MSLFFLWDKVIYRPGSRTVCFSREPSYRYLAQRCISIQSKILSLLFHMDLSPPSPSLFFSSSGLFLRDVNPTEGCAGCAGGGIREARRRLVRCGTLSLKYPEVFFPRNCRSPSFLGSLNGPGYPGRIEKLPACSLSLFLSFSLSLSFLLIFLVPASFFSTFLLAKQFIRASASQTAAHYSTTIKLTELACAAAGFREFIAVSASEES